jgi:hypothetical protein
MFWPGDNSTFMPPGQVTRISLPVGTDIGVVSLKACGAAATGSPRTLMPMIFVSETMAVDGELEELKYVI